MNRNPCKPALLHTINECLGAKYFDQLRTNLENGQVVEHIVDENKLLNAGDNTIFELGSL